MSNSTLRLVLVGALVGSLLAACESPPEPRLEVRSSGVGGSSPTETPTAPATNVPSPTEPAEALKFEPLADLGRGLFFVDVRTGAATRLPRRIASIPGAANHDANYDVSPDGSMILFENARWARGLHQLYVANIDGSHVGQLTDDPRGASQGSWSPDGTKVVYLGGLCCGKKSAVLVVLDLETGTTTELAHGRAFHFWEPFFSVDGNSIHFTDWNNHRRNDLWTIPAGGGRPEPLLEGRGWADPSPDGTSLVYPRQGVWREGNCGGDYGVLWISDADGRDARILVPKATDEDRSTGDPAWSPDGTRLAYSALLVPRGCPGVSNKFGVYVMDVETRHRRLVAFGSSIDWLDDRTLLIRRRGGGGK